MLCNITRREKGPLGLFSLWGKNAFQAFFCLAKLRMLRILFSFASMLCVAKHYLPRPYGPCVAMQPDALHQVPRPYGPCDALCKALLCKDKEPFGLFCLVKHCARKKALWAFSYLALQCFMKALRAFLCNATEGLSAFFCCIVLAKLRAPWALFALHYASLCEALSRT